MNPAPCVKVTPRLAETASALEGIPQCPAMGKLRGTPAGSNGGPKDPENPFPRVSSNRQGVMPTNWRGPVGIEVVAATSQLGMLDSWEWTSVAALASAKVKGVNH